MRLHPYLQLTKPGIVASNLITLSAGYLLAAQGQITLSLWLLTAIGTALIIASGAVCNNLIDRDIDALMTRTQQRPLVLGLISPRHACIYAALLGLTGLALLATYSSPRATALALGGWAIYVGLYSLYFKRHSIHGVAIGSLSGAAPPMIGYCAVNNQLDGAALSLGLILCLWQIPHAYAIALRRLGDYRAARLRLLPLVKGVRLTQRHMQRYILAFTCATPLLFVGGHTGPYYVLVMLVAGGLWAWTARSDAQPHSTPQALSAWGLQLFAYSIVIIMLFSLMVAVDYRVSPPLPADPLKKLLLISS